MKTEKSLAVLTTGGTIGSLIGADEISVEASGSTLRQRLEQLSIENHHRIEISTIANVASPNLEPEDWCLFSDHVRQMHQMGTDCFLITHGTDTLHYTAAFLSLEFCTLPARIFVTGAFFPLNHPKTDAVRNLACSFEAAHADRIGPGVYASFANRRTGGLALVPGLDLMPPMFDEPAFRSVYDKNSDFFGSADRSRSIFTQIKWPADLHPSTPAGLANAKGRIASCRLHPGIDMRLYEALPEGAFLIMEAYHSGTGSALAHERSILALAEARPDMTLCLASMPSPSVPVPYAATRTLLRAGVRVYRDLPPHLLYVAALRAIGTDRLDAEFNDPFASYIL